MDDEFKLCWKNFQDNIASGFQNLYDRGDLVDVTLACDGKLLQAHKIVLAICSPYFQEIFTTNPCQHPIIILKDVSFNIMCELLEFMYQGVVNVKHTELQSFMKIGQLLQIKGLATNSTSPPGSSSSEKSTSQGTQPDDAVNNNNNNGSISKTDATDPSESKLAPSTPSNSRATSPGGSSSTRIANNDSNHLYSLSKRSLPSDFNSDSLSICSRKQLRRSLTNDHGNEGSDNADTASMDNNPLNAEEFFLPPIPHISMVEPRYDLGLKRETEMHHGPPSAAGGGSSGPAASSGSTAVITPSLRNPFGPNFNLDYNFYKANNNNSSNNNGGPGSSSSNASGSISSGNGNGSGGLNTEYPNDLYMPNDYTKNFANHMDIPPIAPGEHWFQGKLEFMLSQRGKPLLVHDGHTFGIQYVRKDKKYWQCNLSRKFNCKARVTTTDTGEIIVTNNEHCHTEIRQHLRKDYQRNKVMMNALINLSTSRFPDLRRHNLSGLGVLPTMLPSALTQGHPPMDEVVMQNLHELAKATAEASQQHHLQQQQQQRAAHEAALKQDMDEPLDCGMRSSSAQLEDMARTLMANSSRVAENLDNAAANDLTKEDAWKGKNEGGGVQH
ncbi:broad-complex core protein isoforms 1/2/3/4/5 isoform X2 [Drosophila tropicalis]|uniref:broad-complex core protein isoforms 1/2/3/4/5 isoform X2 n=1 Tax=Drosophila tropicalis TaxID=46794 RepID=UPI0035ABD2D6